MAKRRLRAPEITSGSRGEFFLHMQRLVLENGDLPTKELGQRSGYSHQAVYKALIGPAMPSQALTERLSRALGGDQAVEQTLPLWKAGVLEERGLCTAPDPAIPPAASASVPGPQPSDATPSRRESTPTQPTRLDRARAAKAAERSIFLLSSRPRDQRPQVESPPRRPHLGVDLSDDAQRALADALRRHFHEAGVAADDFSAEGTRNLLSGWLAGATIPNPLQLTNFAYELQLGSLERTELLDLRSAAVEEQYWNSVARRRGALA